MCARDGGGARRGLRPLADPLRRSRRRRWDTRPERPRDAAAPGRRAGAAHDRSAGPRQRRCGRRSTPRRRRVPAQAAGDQAGSRPASPMIRSCSGASSATSTTGPKSAPERSVAGSCRNGTIASRIGVAGLERLDQSTEPSRCPASGVGGASVNSPRSLRAHAANARPRPPTWSSRSPTVQSGQGRRQVQLVVADVCHQRTEPSGGRVQIRMAHASSFVVAVIRYDETSHCDSSAGGDIPRPMA